MQRDIPIIVKCIRVSTFVVDCYLPARRFGEMLSKDIKVSKSKTKNLESDFERLVRKLHKSHLLLAVLLWCFWILPHEWSPGIAERAATAFHLAIAIRAPTGIDPREREG
jgi:hypothetical protein